MAKNTMTMQSRSGETVKKKAPPPKKKPAPAKKPEPDKSEEAGK